jgi:hypothetical protein
MTEPIKLPPDLLTVTLVREGVNKHRARDVEQWMNEKMAQAVERATAELRDEVERLREALEWIATHDLHGADLTVCGHMAHGFIGKARAALKETK